MCPTGTSSRADGPRRRVRRPRRPAKVAPVMVQEYAHLPLAGLRAYRTALRDEEDKVSYWRRIIQARLDVVRDTVEAAVTGGPTTLDPVQLRSLLVDRRIGAARTALLTIVARDDMPPLPDLSELWQRVFDPADAPSRELLLRDLTTAETRLSDYRRAVFEALEGATGELIARYRVSPTLCLSALPTPPVRAVRAGGPRPTVLPEPDASGREARACRP